VPFWRWKANRRVGGGRVATCELQKSDRRRWDENREDFECKERASLRRGGMERRKNTTSAVEEKQASIALHFVAAQRQCLEFISFRRVEICLSVLPGPPWNLSLQSEMISLRLPPYEA